MFVVRRDIEVFERKSTEEVKQKPAFKVIGHDVFVLINKYILVIVIGTEELNNDVYSV
jgi:hypothetical protein